METRCAAAPGEGAAKATRESGTGNSPGGRGPSGSIKNIGTYRAPQVHSYSSKKLLAILGTAQA
jgi:hypothetical protein